MKKTLSVLIVDDHPIVRDGLAALLSADAAFSPVGTTEGGEELLAFCKANGAPDILVSDVRMPKMDGFQLLARCRKLYPGMAVVLLAGLPLAREEEQARAMGARGYLPKSVSGERLKAILKSLVAKETDFAREEVGEAPDPAVLTTRERAVLELLAKGLTREEIGAVEHVSPETVKTQVRSILLKLDAPNAVAAVATAYKRGILRV